MKRLWIAPVLCVFLWLGCVLPHRLVTQYSAQNKSLLHQCETLVQEENWTAAERSIAEMQTEFDRFRARSTWCLPDQLLVPLESALNDLTGYSRARSRQEWIAAAHRAQTALDRLAESQRLSLDGIL